jgi:hypothetical protein
MNAKWKKALIVSLAGIAVLTILNLFVSIQQYRMASSLLKLYNLPPASNHAENQQNIDSIQQAQETIVNRTENDSIMSGLVLFGLWCVPCALKEAKSSSKNNL